MVGQCYRVQGRAALLRCSGGMGTGAMETEFHGDPCQCGTVSCRVGTSRVPVQDHVTVLEQARLDHEDLGTASLLGRAAVKADRPRDLALANLFGYRDRR